MKERGELNKNTIVTTIMSNLGLYKALDKKESPMIRQQSVTNMYLNP